MLSSFKITPDWLTEASLLENLWGALLGNGGILAQGVGLQAQPRWPPGQASGLNEGALVYLHLGGSVGLLHTLFSRSPEAPQAGCWLQGIKVRPAVLTVLGQSRWRLSPSGLHPDAGGCRNGKRRVMGQLMPLQWLASSLKRVAGYESICWPMSRLSLGHLLLHGAL